MSNLSPHQVQNLLDVPPNVPPDHSAEEQAAAAKAMNAGMVASDRHLTYAQDELHAAGSDAGHVSAENPEADALDGVDWHGTGGSPPMVPGNDDIGPVVGTVTDLSDDHQD
jgi:hypothetical protein